VGMELPVETLKILLQTKIFVGMNFNPLESTDLSVSESSRFVGIVTTVFV